MFLQFAYNLTPCSGFYVYSCCYSHSILFCHNNVTKIIIVLEINDKDYLLTEIAQIVESNDAKVLSMYITSHPDSTKFEVTLKINKMDVGSILQTFNRYDYIISASFTEDTYTDNLQDRFDSLMNYLNI